MNFIIEKDMLTIELQGKEQIWALKSKIEIAKNTITSINYQKVFDDWRKWEVRLPGTGMPGKLIAGSFWTEQGWDFLYLKNPKGWLNPTIHNVLVIHTKLPKYKRIIVSVCPNEAEKLTQWLA